MNQKPQELEDVYDIIIVGGGTAGCVLASRISEDASLKVLLLEAGGSGKSLFFSRTPVMFPLLFKTEHVWPIHTEPQVFADGTARFWPRGKLLGGCSSTNGQVAHYGNPTDYDEWAALTNDDSWSWRNFQKYFRKFEGYLNCPRGPSYENDAIGKTSDGPMTMGFNNYESNSGVAFIEACKNFGIPLSSDFHGEQGTSGVGRLRTFIDSRGQRVSTETAYLTDAVRKRGNLKILTNVQVIKILIEEKDSQKRAVGVEYSPANVKSKADVPRYRVRCRGEVILSAGSIHSPHLLMLSGVGPSDHLKEKNIDVVHNLPDVGQHLFDHALLDLYYKDRTKKAPNYLQPQSIPEAFKMFSATIQYLLFGTGALTVNWGESAAFIRTDDPQLFPAAEYPRPLVDTTSGPGSPDIEILTYPVGSHSHGDFFPVPTFAIHPILLRPTSQGTIRLASNDPWTNPIVDPHYGETEADVDRFVRSLKLIGKITQTEPLASLIEPDPKYPNFDHNMHLKTDEELRQLVKARMQTCYHPTSTCRMLPLDKGGVLDSEMRIHGISNLRVCDASIFPLIVSGHTASAVIAAAEKLSDMVKAEYLS